MESETSYEVKSESVPSITSGSIQKLRITVKSVTEYKVGSPSVCDYIVEFHRTDNGHMKWFKTYDETDQGAMSNQHIIATDTAAEYVEEQYGDRVRLGLLE